MPENIILYLFLWIIAWVFTAIIGTLILKFLKWSINIKLFKKTYTYWEEIKWTFTLHAKKNIQWQDLNMHLIGYTKETSYSSKWQRNTRQVEFTRFSKHVESNTLYNAWMKRDYDITIKIPEVNEIFSEDQIPDLWDGVLWKLAKYALTKSRKQNYSWEVRVDLEAEGLDLSSNKQIFISKKI